MSECVIAKPRKTRRPRPPRGCRATGKKSKIVRRIRGRRPRNWCSINVRRRDSSLRHAFRPAVEPTYPFIEWVTGGKLQGFTTHLNIAQLVNSWSNTSVHLNVLMAWYFSTGTTLSLSVSLSNKCNMGGISQPFGCMWRIPQIKLTKSLSCYGINVKSHASPQCP